MFASLNSVQSEMFFFLCQSWFWSCRERNTAASLVLSCPSWPAQRCSWPTLWHFYLALWHTAASQRARRAAQHKLNISPERRRAHQFAAFHRLCFVLLLLLLALLLASLPAQVYRASANGSQLEPSVSGHIWTHSQASNIWIPALFIQTDEAKQILHTNWTIRVCFGFDVLRCLEFRARATIIGKQSEVNVKI